METQVDAFLERIRIHQYLIDSYNQHIREEHAEGNTRGVRVFQQARRMQWEVVDNLRTRIARIQQQGG